MPSPFPGMNPFLEHPSVWPDFHDGFIYRLRSLLAPLVRPKYFVRMQDQIYLHELPDGEARPAGRPDLTLSTTEAIRGRETSTAVLNSPSRVTLLDPVDEIRSDYLEVVDRSNDRVVTAIELLSPSNKNSGADRHQYLSKRRRLLKAGVHFVEIDLLRSGPRTVPSMPACDYIVMVARTPELPEAGVWPNRLEEPLPLIPLPLAAGDRDVTLNLKTALDAVYDESGYEDFLYRHEPDPPLTAEQKLWAANFVPKMR